VEKGFERSGGQKRRLWKGVSGGQQVVRGLLFNIERETKKTSHEVGRELKTRPKGNDLHTTKTNREKKRVQLMPHKENC